MAEAEEIAKPDSDRPIDPARDAKQAIRFMAIKVAIFILLPLAAAAVAVMLTLK